MGGRSATGVAAAYWLGTLLGGAMMRGGGPAGFPLACALLALVPVAWIVRARAVPAVAGILLVAVAVGAARGGAAQARIERARATLGGTPLRRVVAEVEGHPGRAADRPLVTLRVRGAEPPLPGGTRVRLRAPEGSTVEWGDRVEGLVALEKPSPRRNPGGSDPRRAADAAGIAAVGRAITLRATGRTPVGRGLAATAVRWRRSIERRLVARLGPVARELVPPLVTGDRSGLPTGIDADFRASGLVHLLALSGLHVTALAAVARMLAASAGGGGTARAAAGIVAALFYLAIAGPLPALMRAAASECWTGAARILRRPADPLQALACSALALLAWRPGWAGDLGFQLSCLATAGIALAASWSPPGRGARIVRALGTTLAAQAACAPVLVARIHGLAWPALVVNLVAVPLGGLLLISAWIALIADGVGPGLGHFFFAACEPIARALAAVTAQAARWPGSLLPAGHDPGPVAIAAVGLALMAIAAAGPRDLEARRAKRPPGVAALRGLGAFALGAGVVAAVTTPALRPPRGETWVMALDVGQGDATAVGDERGWWLVDAGPRSPRSDAGERVVRPFLRWGAIRSLRTLVLTHADTDHTGGAPAVLRAVPSGPIAGPDVPHAPAGVQVRLARGGPLGVDGARVLWPPPATDSLDRAIALRDDNAGGVVIEIARGPTRVLLTADVDSVVEDRLRPGGPVALLKVGHHGSASSTGSGFLDRAGAGRAWISAGAHNVYGHPAPAALERLAAAGVRVDRTDLEGALLYAIDALGVRRLDWRHPGAPARPPAGSWPGGAAAAPRSP